MNNILFADNADKHGITSIYWKGGCTNKTVVQCLFAFRNPTNEFLREHCGICSKHIHTILPSSNHPYCDIQERHIHVKQSTARATILDNNSRY